MEGSGCRVLDGIDWSAKNMPSWVPIFDLSDGVNNGHENLGNGHENLDRRDVACHVSLLMPEKWWRAA
jgi:hypothetical protein